MTTTYSNTFGDYDLGNALNYDNGLPGPTDSVIVTTDVQTISQPVYCYDINITGGEFAPDTANLYISSYDPNSALVFSSSAQYVNSPPYSPFTFTNISPAAVFKDYSVFGPNPSYQPTFSGNIIFEGSSTFSSGTISGNVTFNDNAQMNNGMCGITGDVTVTGTNNVTGGNIYGNAYDYTNNTVGWNGGVVSGTLELHGNYSDNNWPNPLSVGMWYVAATVVFTMSTAYSSSPPWSSSADAGSTWNFQSGVTNTGVVTGNANFTTNSSNSSGGVVYGNAVFSWDSYGNTGGSINGNMTLLPSPIGATYVAANTGTVSGILFVPGLSGDPRGILPQVSATMWWPGGGPIPSGFIITGITTSGGDVFSGAILS